MCIWEGFVVTETVKKGSFKKKNQNTSTLEFIGIHSALIYDSRLKGTTKNQGFAPLRQL